MSSPAKKRIFADIRELKEDKSGMMQAQPLEENMFEWHFTIRGPPDTEFEGGIYHGRIILPSDYPLKPPSIIVLTPNGRFETKKKICLSISSYHPELWQPAWGIRTILEAIISFLPSPGEGAIGSLDYPAEERKRLAKLSVDYECPKCGKVAELLPPLNKDEFKLTYGNVINELSAADPKVVDESILKQHEDVEEGDDTTINKEKEPSPTQSTPSSSTSTPNENKIDSTPSNDISQPPPPSSIPSTTTNNMSESNRSELRHRNVNSSTSDSNTSIPTSSISPPPAQPNQNHHAQQFVQQLNVNQQQQHGVVVNDSSIVDQFLSYIIYLFYIIIALILLKKTSRKFM